MPRKKSPNNNYFNEDVEAAIHNYNLSTDERERNRIFGVIYPALGKIAEVWRNKIKPTYVELPPDELEMDCVCFMLEKLPMIKEGKGKAFSYLTVTARNYYIQANMKAYKKKLKGYSLDSLPDTFDIIDVPSDRVEQMEWNGKLFDSFIEYVDENFQSMFPHKKQKKFAEPFFEKIKSIKFADEINRREMLNELSNQTGMERGLVTKHVNRVASFFSTFKKYFEENGKKPIFKEKLHINKEDEQYIKQHYIHYSKQNGVNGISRKLGVKHEVLKNWLKESNII